MGRPAGRPGGLTTRRSAADLSDEGGGVVEHELGGATPLCLADYCSPPSTHSAMKTFVSLVPPLLRFEPNTM